jgi:hypothetical protein
MSGLPEPVRPDYDHYWYPLLSIVNIDRMGAPDMMLFTLLAVADGMLLLHLYRRRQRRYRSEQMMRCLIAAVRREVGVFGAVTA